MNKSEEIKCPKCGKVCGEWESDHVNIKRINLLVYGANAMPRKCPGCGELFDEDTITRLANGDYVCESCYMDLIDRAENAYDVARDEGRI